MVKEKLHIRKIIAFIIILSVGVTAEKSLAGNNDFSVYPVYIKTLCDGQYIPTDLIYNLPIIPISEQWEIFQNSKDIADKSIINVFNAFKNNDPVAFQSLISNTKKVTINPPAYVAAARELLFKTNNKLYVVGKIPIENGYEYIINLNNSNNVLTLVWTTEFNKKFGEYKILASQKNSLLEWVIDSIAASQIPSAINYKPYKPSTINYKQKPINNTFSENQIIMFLKMNATEKGKNEIKKFYDDCLKNGLLGKFTAESEKNAEIILNSKNKIEKKLFIQNVISSINNPLIVINGGKVFFVINRINGDIHAATIYNDPTKGLLFTNIGGSSPFEDFFNSDQIKNSNVEDSVTTPQ